MSGQPRSIEYDASQHPITQVTVFQFQRAEVTRNIQVVLSNGLNNIEVKNLPNGLDRDSIIVEGLGNAIILDVVYHAPSTEIPKVGLEPELVKNEKKLEQRLEIGRRQARMLKDFSETFTADNTTPEKFEAFLDVFANRQYRIDRGTTALEDELSTLRTQMAEVTIQAKEDREKMKSLRVGITIMVSATGGKRGDMNAEIKLTYAVTGAWWAPHYDVRAVTTDIGKHGHDTGDVVHLHYQALVAQSTGEDWLDVALSLSTSQPLQRSDLPKLKPQWLSLKPKEPVPMREYHNYVPTTRSWSPQHIHIHTVTDSLRGRSRSPTRVVVAGSRRSRSRSPVIHHRRRSLSPTVIPLETPDFIRTLNAQPSDNAVSTTYAVAGLASIPSGGPTRRGRSDETHKVTVAELQFAGAVLEWSCVPKMASGVYLQCRMSNQSNYVLLAGQANVFLNGSFIAKTTFPRAMPQEDISCPFGTDPSLKVTYHPRITKTKKTGLGTPLGINIGNKTSTTTYEQNISIRNLRPTKIRRLIVKDQVPVSRDDSIKVAIVEPKELRTGGPKISGIVTGVGLNLSRRTSNSGSTATYTGSRHEKDKLILTGTLAQAAWSTADDSAVTPAVELSPNLGGSENLGASLGLFEWVCQLDSGASVDLKAAWEVSVPVGTVAQLS